MISLQKSLASGFFHQFLGNLYWTKGTSTSCPFSSSQQISKTKLRTWLGIFFFETLSTTWDIVIFILSSRRAEKKLWDFVKINSWNDLIAFSNKKSSLIRRFCLSKTVTHDSLTKEGIKPKTVHSENLRHWNSKKSVKRFWIRFPCLLEERITKILRKLKSHNCF